MCAGSVPCETGMADVCSLVAPPHTHQMSSMWCTGIATPGSLLGNKQGIAKYSGCADLCTCSVGVSTNGQLFWIMSKSF